MLHKPMFHLVVWRSQLSESDAVPYPPCHHLPLRRLPVRDITVFDKMPVVYQKAFYLMKCSVASILEGSCGS
jgi:hypothetical protein